jgi:DNA-directed DNA polymerase III PolC
MSFIHLRIHSNFSLLAGTRPVEDLVRAAAEAGMPALALTDTNGLYAVVPFRRACAEYGVRPIYGTELVGPWEGAGGDGRARSARGGGGEGPDVPLTRREGGRDDHPGTPARAVLLARSIAGYREISRLVTARHLDADFSLRAALDAISENVYVLTDDERVLRRLRGRRYLRAALPVAQGRECDRTRWRLHSLAARLGVRTAAAGAVFFLDAREHFIHRVLTAIRTRTTVGTLPTGEAAPPEAWFYSPGVVERVFRDDPASLAAVREIADDCRVELDLDSNKLPVFPLPPGESAVSFLRRIAMKGLRERLGGADAALEGRERACGRPHEVSGHADGAASGGPESAASRTRTPAPCSGADMDEYRRALETLEYELSVVERRGLAGYFLICWDIVRFARSRGMRSLGRGSAGNSILSFALGITHVNPLRHNLFFERFLNPEREQPPDFDIDFGTDDREEVLQYIFRRYGRAHVAMIGTYCTMRARAALRETAKAIGIPEGEIAPFVRRIPFYASIDHLAEVCAVSPAASDIPLGREPLRTLLPLAVKIGGFPRHMGTHPCGLVISPDPITDLVPLQRGDKGYEITQWSMHEVEEAGLVKIDVIGQKGLAVIGEAAAMAAENEGRPLHPERIGYLNDPETKRALREGKTEGCFYIESPVMVQLIRQAKCDDFEVLTALSSIIRPGVSSYGGKRQYLHRHLGLEPVAAIHPAVRDVLRDTYGCLIYQEQVIRIAVAVAGMSYAEADGLRRCMSFKEKGDETMNGYRESFMRGARERGIPDDTADEIFRQISSFAGYAFCKAHSASFALESFESVYWKTHYPAEFMAAVLSNGGGYYSQEEYLEEARRMGLVILPPCVNRSRVRHYGRGRRLRIGLMQVKNLTVETAECIVSERPFGSLGEFLARVPAARDEVENLIRCGAMASFGRSRPELLWELRCLRADERGEAGRAGAGETAAPPALDPAAFLGRIPEISDYPLPRSIALEREILGLTVSAHPLAMFQRDPAPRARRSFVRSVELPRCVGRDVKVVGWKVTAKATRTADGGEQMIFVTFSDQWGRFEAVLFPEVYRRTARELVRGPGPFVIRGRVESELGVESLIVRDLRYEG